MRKLSIFWFLTVMLLLVNVALAGDWYVRPSSQGNANGKDWNNAWKIDGIAWGSIKAGDTIWLAGGKYSSHLAVSASGSASGDIKILRATASDNAATSVAGWNASLDAQVQFSGNGSIYIPASSYITIDGRTQYGILITLDDYGWYAIEAITGGNRGSHLTFKNIDVNGGYRNMNGNPPATKNTGGWKISPGGGSPSDATDILFDHCRVRGCSMGFHCLASNVTVQYCILQDFWPSYADDHPDILYCYPSPNMTWRYNYIANCSVDGMFFESGGAENFQFYGNVFFSTKNHMIYFKNQGYAYGPAFIYNNVFHSPSPEQYVYGYLSTSSYINTVKPGGKLYNNIFFNVSNDMQGMDSDYNAYNYTRLGGYDWPSHEQHSFTFTGSPFVKLSGPSWQGPVEWGDFHLSSDMETKFRNGIALANDGYLNKDMDGNKRGNPWYMGAYQYGGVPGPSPTSTPAPTATPAPSPTSTPAPTATPAPSPTSTPAPTATPTPAPTPTVTWEKWIEDLDNWIRAHPPYPDQK